MRWLKAMVVATLLLAGCVGPEQVHEGRSDEEVPVAAPIFSDENGTALLGEPVTQTFYFHEDLSLRPVAPEPSKVLLSGGVGGFAANMLGLPSAGIVTTFTGPAMEFGGQIDASAFTAHVVVSTETVAPSNGVFDIGVWGGSTAAMGLFDFQSQNLPLTSASPITYDLDLSQADFAPIYIAALGAIQIYVGNGFVHVDDTDAVFMELGPQGSSINVTYTPFNFDPVVGLTSVYQEDKTGTLQGVNPFFCGTNEGYDYEHHKVTILENATYLYFGSEAEGTDLDIDLYDRGTKIAGGHTPYDRETIILLGDDVVDLRGKELTLTVSLCLKPVKPSVPYIVHIQQMTYAG